MASILPVKLDRVERAEYGGAVVLPAAEQVKDRQAGLIDDDRLAVDEARLHRQFLDRLDDQVPANR